MFFFAKKLCESKVPDGHHGKGRSDREVDPLPLRSVDSVRQGGPGGRRSAGETTIDFTRLCKLVLKSLNNAKKRLIDKSRKKIRKKPCFEQHVNASNLQPN